MKGFACFNTLKDVYGHYTLKKAFWNYHDNHPGDDAMALVNLYLPFFMFYRNSSEEEPGPPFLSCPAPTGHPYPYALQHLTL